MLEKVIGAENLKLIDEYAQDPLLPARVSRPWEGVASCAWFRLAVLHQAVAGPTTLVATPLRSWVSAALARPGTPHVDGPTGQNPRLEGPRPPAHDPSLAVAGL